MSRSTSRVRVETHTRTPPSRRPAPRRARARPRRRCRPRARAGCAAYGGRPPDAGRAGRRRPDRRRDTQPDEPPDGVRELPGRAARRPPGRRARRGLQRVGHVAGRNRTPTTPPTRPEPTVAVSVTPARVTTSVASPALARRSVAARPPAPVPTTTTSVRRRHPGCRRGQFPEHPHADHSPPPGRPIATMRSTARRARSAMAGSTRTSSTPSRRLRSSRRRVLLHVRAGSAGVHGHEIRARGRLAQLVQHAHLGGHEDAAPVRGPRLIEHAAGGQDVRPLGGQGSPRPASQRADVVQPHSGWTKSSASGLARTVASRSAGEMSACTWHSPSQT